MLVRLGLRVDAAKGECLGRLVVEIWCGLYVGRMGGKYEVRRKKGGIG